MMTMSNDGQFMFVDKGLKSHVCLSGCKCRKCLEFGILCSLVIGIWGIPYDVSQHPLDYVSIVRIFCTVVLLKIELHHLCLGRQVVGSELEILLSFHISTKESKLLKIGNS